jgi:hypothetical protein
MASTAVVAPKNNLLEFDRTDFQAKFPDAGFKIRHRLCQQPELQLPALIELAQRLPESAVEYYSGDVSRSQGKKTYPGNGLSIVETVRRIEECGSWMVMQNVQVDPGYGALLRSLLDEWYQQIDPRRLKQLRGARNREKAFIFISSPGSVTPYHLDDEHNFLLQVRGSKHISMWDVNDRVVMPERQAEHMLQYWHPETWDRYMPYEDDFEKRAALYELGPGEGLHFPFGAPHWVKNGPAVSISFSITFRSELSDERAILYGLNGRMRRMGINPSPPGQSRWRDSLKYRTFRAAKTIKGFLPDRRRL